MYGTPYSNKELLAELDKCVYGHTHAKRVLINAVNRSKIRWQQIHCFGIHPDEAVKIKNVLLLGKSGTGKTFLFENVARLSDVSFMKFDATHFTNTGYVGKTSIEQIIKEIQSHCAHVANQSGYKYTVQEVMDSTIILIDEIDKTSRAAKSDNDWYKKIQSSLLQLLDGKNEISGVTFILAGAFADDLEYLQKEKAKHGIGFSGRSEEVAEETDWDEFIVNAGIIPELAGRISSVVKLDELTEKDYNKILNEHVLVEARKSLAYYECFDFDVAHSEKKRIVKKAMKSRQGVRMLQKEVQKLVEDIEFDFEERRDALLLEYTKEITGE